MKHRGVNGPSLGWLSDQAGRNVSERWAGLETGNARDDPSGIWGSPMRDREESDTSTDMSRRGSGAGTSGRWKAWQHGKPCWCRSTRQTGIPRGADWACRVAERFVVLKTRGNARRGKGPQGWRADLRAKGVGIMAEPTIRITSVRPASAHAKVKGLPLTVVLTGRNKADQRIMRRLDCRRGACYFLCYGLLQTFVWCSACEPHDPPGEPDAGKLHVRFGGRREETRRRKPD